MFSNVKKIKNVRTTRFLLNFQLYLTEITISLIIYLSDKLRLCNTYNWKLSNGFLYTACTYDSLIK